MRSFKRLLTVFLLALLTAFSALPTTAADTGPIIVELLPCRYEFIDYNAEGRLFVRENGLEGYLDLSGNVIVEPQYEVSYFWNGLSAITRGEEIALIDRQGNLVLPFTTDHEAVYDFWRKLEVYPPDDKFKAPPVPDGYRYPMAVGSSYILASVSDSNSDEYHLLDLAGNRVNDVAYSGAYRSLSNRDVTFFRLYLMRLPGEDFTRYESYDKNSNLTHSGIGDLYNNWRDPEPFDGEVHLVLMSGALGFHKYGAVDGHGRIIIPASLTDVRIVDEGIFRLQYEERSWLANFVGERLTQDYSRLDYLGGGRYAAQLDGLYGIMTLEGKIVLPFDYEELSHISGDLFLASQKGQDGIINSAGEVLLPFGQYEYMRPLYWSVPNLLEVRQGGFSGLLQVVDSPANLPSGWARDDVAWAREKITIPAALLSDYRRPITRAEFCSLAVAAVEAENRRSIGYLLEKKGLQAQGEFYTDCNDPDVVAATLLGVVQGVGDGLFAPDVTLTREQAAVLLCNLRTALNRELPKGELPDYADRAALGAWAKEAVADVSIAGLMQGVDGNYFDPTGLLTREQAIVILLRSLL